MNVLAATIHTTTNASTPTDDAAALVVKGGAAIVKDVRIGGVLAYTTIQTTAAAFQMNSMSLTLSATDVYFMIEVVFVGSATITLPLASTCPGKQYFIVKLTNNSNTLTIARSGSDDIDGVAANITSLTQAVDRVRLTSNGNATWYTG